LERIMTLTVRLDDTLESALERHCAITGSSKSAVVQESLAVYLLGRERLANKVNLTGQTGKAKQKPSLSAHYLAFAAAGLIGTGEGGGISADKATVRERALQRLSRPSP
jgi:hypothetical protein